MSQDTLSDILRGVRLRGAVFFYVSGHGGWAAEAPLQVQVALNDLLEPEVAGRSACIDASSALVGRCVACSSRQRAGRRAGH